MIQDIQSPVDILKRQSPLKIYKLNQNNFMPPRKQQKMKVVEDEEYINGMPKSEMGDPWTKDERERFKMTLISLNKAG